MATENKEYRLSNRNKTNNRQYLLTIPIFLVQTKINLLRLLYIKQTVKQRAVQFNRQL